MINISKLYTFQGQYRVYPKGILFCNLHRYYDIQSNLYLNRKSKFVTELKGNITLKIPLDDSLKVSICYDYKYQKIK